MEKVVGCDVRVVQADNDMRIPHQLLVRGRKEVIHNNQGLDFDDLNIL